jgi:hypothetical protein
MRGITRRLRTTCGRVAGIRWFWPEKDIESASKRLSDSLNPHRDERLSDEQERLIMRRACHARRFSAALYFLCDDTGFERPNAIPPRDRRDVLLREFNDRVGQLALLSAAIEELAKESGIRVVK